MLTKGIVKTKNKFFNVKKSWITLDIHRKNSNVISRCKKFPNEWKIEAVKKKLPSYIIYLSYHGNSIFGSKYFEECIQESYEKQSATVTMTKFQMTNHFSF